VSTIEEQKSKALARLQAALRERGLREAADVVGKRMDDKKAWWGTCSPANALMIGFSWIASEEGYDFWCDCHEKLQKPALTYDPASGNPCPMCGHVQTRSLRKLASKPAPHNGVAESILAARGVTPSTKVRHYVAILDRLRSDGPLTDEDLSADYGIPPNSLRPRRGELARAGLIESKPGGTTASGRAARLWALTDAGLRVLREMEGKQ
jgi:hypothetical protein